MNLLIRDNIWILRFRDPRPDISWITTCRRGDLPKIEAGMREVGPAYVEEEPILVPARTRVRAGGQKDISRLQGAYIEARRRDTRVTYEVTCPRNLKGG